MLFKPPHCLPGYHSRLTRSSRAMDNNNPLSNCAWQVILCLLGKSNNFIEIMSQLANNLIGVLIVGDYPALRPVSSQVGIVLPVLLHLYCHVRVKVVGAFTAVIDEAALL